MTPLHLGTMRSAAGEVSGAFGDVGTLLPYAITGILAGTFAPVPVFVGFALGYLLVALVYRLPVAVQPMKALGAVAITGGLSALETAWAGAAIGAVLLALSAVPHIARWARMVPQSVIVGLQVGLGLTLGSLAFTLMREDWRLAGPALLVLSLSHVWPRGPWALLTVGAAVGGGLLWPLAAADMNVVAPADAPCIWTAMLVGVLPQLPLTLINAVILTVAICHSLHGPRAARVSERRLAATSGVLNLLLAPFGAFPMCHGAGGAVAHHRFGARGVGAPLVMAAACAALALSGPTLMDTLARIPMPVVGALLAHAAADLAFSRRLVDARPDCRPVIAAAAVATFFFGAAAGLATGLVSEKIRAHIRRKAPA